MVYIPLRVVLQLAQQGDTDARSACRAYSRLVRNPAAREHAIHLYMTDSGIFPVLTLRKAV